MAAIAYQIREIGENVERLAGEDVKQKVMEGSKRIAGSSKPAEVAEWTKNAMQRLDALVDEKTRNEIMMNCGRNCARANKGPTERAKARRRKYKTVDEFLEAEQRKPPTGTRLAREGSVLYQFYTPRSYTRPMRCYCSLLRGLPDDETVSLTYCRCSRGFVQEYWESVLERPVEVELLQSAVSGAQECKFAIRL